MHGKLKRLKGIGALLVAIFGAFLFAPSSSADSPDTPGSTSPSSADPASTVHIPTIEEARSFTFMTPEQYEAKVGAKKAAEQRIRVRAIAETTVKAQEAANPK